MILSSEWTAARQESSLHSSTVNGVCEPSRIGENSVISFAVSEGTTEPVRDKFGVSEGVVNELRDLHEFFTHQKEAGQYELPCPHHHCLFQLYSSSLQVPLGLNPYYG